MANSNRKLKKLLALPSAEIAPMPPPEMRECAICHKLKPYGDFRVIDDGVVGLRLMCNYCADTAPARAEAERRQAVVRESAKQLIAACRGDKLRAPGVAELYAGMVAEFGGVKSICAEWKQQIDLAMINTPGSRNVLDQFYTIFKMGAVVGEQTRRQVETLSDDELRDELADYVTRYLPQLVESSGENDEQKEAEADEHCPPAE